MAPKSKKAVAMELPVQPPPTPHPLPLPSEGRGDKTVPPSSLEFLADRLWCIEKFEDLAAEYHLTVGVAGDWSKVGREFFFLAREHARQWVVVRRLFGIAPVIPPEGTHPDDLKIWQRPELEAQGYAVTAELDALRAIWRTHCQRAVEPAEPVAMVATKAELDLDDGMLVKFQFMDRIFKITVWDPVTKLDYPRTSDENKAEREWFLGQVKGWQKMLADSIGGPIAREALMTNLYLRRLEAEIATSSSKDVDKLYERQKKLSASYQEKVDRLQEMFPEMAVAGKVSFRGVVSDLVAAVRDYYANGDNRLVNKVMTAAEVEFVMRESQQVGSRHRFSLELAIIESMHGLYDPNFRSILKPNVLRKIDVMMRAAREAVREATGEQVVDLEKGVMPGEPDSFEDFNDATCPECEARISSALKKCPHCGMENPNDVVVEEVV